MKFFEKSTHLKLKYLTILTNSALQFKIRIIRLRLYLLSFQNPMLIEIWKEQSLFNTL